MDRNVVLDITKLPNISSRFPACTAMIATDENKDIRQCFSNSESW
jgi:hypothetical protein